jgi:hypothetical protein
MLRFFVVVVSLSLLPPASCRCGAHAAALRFLHARNVANSLDGGLLSDNYCSHAAPAASDIGNQQFQNVGYVLTTYDTVSTYNNDRGSPTGKCEACRASVASNYIHNVV